MNDVITNLVGKMRITRHENKVVPNLEDELFKWAMECKYITSCNSRVGCLLKINVLGKDSITLGIFDGPVLS